MVLVKPVLNPSNNFDATKQNTFTFSYNGNEQIVKNELTIRDNLRNEVVYTNTQNTFKYENVLPPNVLTNGEYYNAFLIVYDNNGNQSAQSNVIQFYCYSTPVLSFTNLPPNNIVNNPSYVFNIEYTQEQNQSLNAYSVKLYDSNQQLIMDSGELYPQSTEVPLNLTYQLNGLNDNTVYYIQLIGSIIGNLVFNTDLIQFTVNYSVPTLYTLLEITNMCQDGYINIISNLITIDGETNADPPIYLGNEELDLTKEGDYALWNKEFSINNDFTLMLSGRNFTSNSNILFINNDNDEQLNIFYGERKNSDGNLNCYVSLTGSGNNLIPYYIYSNYIEVPSALENVFIWLRRVNNVYEIKIDNLGVNSNRLSYYIESSNPDVYYIDESQNYYIGYWGG